MKKEISISRRSKYKDFSEGIEYILSTDNRPLISCTNLSEIANYALSLSKNRGLDSISYEVSDMVNGSYFYSKLNQNELKNIKSYFHRKEMLKVR